MSASHKLRVNSESETDALGAWLAKTLPAGCVVALTGTLGAGKTRLVQAIAAAQGIPREDVVSPTFVLCQVYSGRIAHFDAYRLNDSDEFLQLGAEDYFESEMITLIEWADLIEDCLPDDYVEIHLEVVGRSSRECTLTTHGKYTDSLAEPLESYVS